MSNIAYDNVLDFADLRPSRLKPEGRDSGSFCRAIDLGAQLSRKIDAGVWKAEPGVYRHPGSDLGETFIVVEGAAEIEIQGFGSFELHSGRLITIPPITPSIMRVSETLVKLSLIDKK
ncbi:cupin domain-containing protein [Ensifer sp. B1-9]|uniref:cupin domain-containing protein n=1 Tax=Ensifer sp. B1-9 TaxID=3141455 RepID=UPI003D1B744A